MPKQPNKLARILVPLALFAVSVLVAVAVITNTKKSQQSGGPPRAPGEARTPAAADPAQPREAATDVASDHAQAVPPTAERTPDPQASDEQASDAHAGAEPAAQPESADPDPEATYAAQTFEGDPLASGFLPLGSLEFKSTYEMLVEFSHVGAGVESIRLTHRLDTVASDRAAQKGTVDPAKHVQVQAAIVSERYRRDQVTGAPVNDRGEPVGPGERPAVEHTMLLVPLAAADLEIDGRVVGLAQGPGDAPVWRQVAPDRAGEFEAFIIDGTGRRVARAVRRYRLDPGSHDLRLEQRVENLSGRPLTMRWRQFGPADMEEDELGYGGSKRRVRFGYLFSPSIDPARQHVQAKDFLWHRDKLASAKSFKQFPEGVIWPNTRSLERQYDLAWVGLTNRYFASVVHPLIDPDAQSPDKVLRPARSVKRVFGHQGEIILALEGPRTEVPSGGALRADLGFYAGPLSTEVIGAEPRLEAAGVSKIVVFNFGGPCGFCTFPWLTGPLLALLRVLHSLTSDWALAIILLVVCVRTILHPITRWSQIRMQKFTKQMQNMAPKQKIIQEKFKDDRQRMQQEMARLWREEGVSPAGFLGCLPMFLQSPVWIALYATLYFAIDLRHEPAFFGVFQSLTGNAWPFLSDLSVGDRALYFGGAGITLPLMGTISSINLLPLLLGVVFFMHQKYLTPPPTASLTPEQESQQKLMKIMMVVMFPVFMYNAPSGLALYFITNSSLGILESRWIRSHVEKHGMLSEENLRKKPKKDGFLARLKAMAEEQQRLKQQGAGPKRVPNTAGRGRTQPPQRKFKKR